MLPVHRVIKTQTLLVLICMSNVSECKINIICMQFPASNVWLYCLSYVSVLRGTDHNSFYNPQCLHTGFVLIHIALICAAYVAVTTVTTKQQQSIRFGVFIGAKISQADLNWETYFSIQPQTQKPLGNDIFSLCKSANWFDQSEPVNLQIYKHTNISSARRN